MNASRLHPELGQVSEARSFLKSRTRQMTLSVSGERERDSESTPSTPTRTRDQSLGFEERNQTTTRLGVRILRVCGRADEERQHQFEASMTIPIRKESSSR